MPLVIGVVAGLIGSKFEDKNLASKDLITDVISNLDVEIASHGYYHSVQGYGLRRNVERLVSRMGAPPDKFDYILRALHCLKYKQWNKNGNYASNAFKEIVTSKKTLEATFGRSVNTFLYPGGYVSNEMLNLIRENYNFARNSEVGINASSDLKDESGRFSLRSISISKYTSLSKIEEYYKEYSKKEKANGEFIVIEIYHNITGSKTRGLYDCLYSNFQKHCQTLKEIGTFCQFRFHDDLE